MKLTHINVWSSWENKICDEQDRDTFCYMMRSICNFISKAVRKYHIITEPQIRMISVDAGMRPDGTRLLANNVLNVNLRIDESSLESFFNADHDVARYEYGLALLERGYRLAALEYNLPLDELLSIHDDFRDGHYLNEWKYPGLGITDDMLKISFRGRLSLYEFELIMDCMDRKTNRRFSAPVLHTAPDEIYFQRLFKTVSVVNGELTINDYFGNILIRVNLDKLRNMELDLTYSSNRAIQTAEIIERIKWTCSKTSPVQQRRMAVPDLK